MELPFEIGQVLWLAVGTPHQVTLPCPVCAGQLFVTVELGSGERIAVPCEACGKGYGGPRGVIEEWEHSPSIQRFEIASVRSMHEGRWWVESTTGAMANFDELCATEGEALTKATAQAAAQHESNMQSHQRHRKNTKETTWSVRYHRKCIADLEQQIAWHQGKLSAPKVEAGVGV